MTYRTLPFGYHMQGGRICVKADEAEIVQMVYARRAEGWSYQQITDQLNKRGVLYMIGKQWNKNMTARILQDVRYQGNAIFPAIVTSVVSPGAANTSSGKLHHPEVKGIRILAHCAVCGGPVQRENNDRAAWSCPDCTARRKPKDEQIINAVKWLLQILINAPDIVVCPPTMEAEDSHIREAQDKFSSELGRDTFDEPAVRASVIAAAEAQLNALGSADYETTRIRYILSKAERRDSLDTDLLRQISSAVLLHPEGIVSLKLKNDQIVGGYELT